MMRAAAIAALMATAAAAQDVIEWRSAGFPNDEPSSGTLQETDEPGAIAEFVFRDRKVNSASDNGTQTLTLGGLNIAVTFEWMGSENDMVILEVPPGYFVIPERLVAGENGRPATALIYPETLEAM